MIWSAELNKAFKLNINISTSSAASYNSLVRMNTVRISISCLTLTICSALEQVPSGSLQRRWGNQLVVEVPFHHLPHQKYSAHKVRNFSFSHTFVITVIILYHFDLRQIPIAIAMNSTESKILQNVRSHRDQSQI